MSRSNGIKRIIALALSFVFAFGFAGAVKAGEVNTRQAKLVLFTIGSKTITADGASSEISIAPVLQGKNSMLALRVAKDVFGGTLGWEDKTKTATLTVGNRVAAFRVGQDYMTVGSLMSAGNVGEYVVINKQVYTLDTPPQLINDITFIPFQALAHAFDKNVVLNGNVISIIADTTKEVTSVTPPSMAPTTEAVYVPEVTPALIMAEENNRRMRLNELKKWLTENNDSVWSILKRNNLTSTESAFAIDWLIKLACYDLDIDPLDRNIAPIDRNALLTKIEENYVNFPDYTFWFPIIVFERMVDFRHEADVKENRHTLERLLVSSNNLAVKYYPDMYYFYNPDVQKGKTALPTAYPYVRYAKYFKDNDEYGAILTGRDGKLYGRYATPLYSITRNDPSARSSVPENTFKLDRKLIEIKLNDDKKVTADYIAKDLMLNYIIRYDEKADRYYYRTYEEFLIYAKQMIAENPKSRQAIIDMAFNAPIYLGYSNAPQYTSPPFNLFTNILEKADKFEASVYDGTIMYKPTDAEMDSLYTKVVGLSEKFAAE